MRPQARADGKLRPADPAAYASLTRKQSVQHWRHMHRLDIAVPGIFMRMHDLIVAAGAPPGVEREPDLIQPTRPRKVARHAVIHNTRGDLGELLGEDVNLVA